MLYPRYMKQRLQEAMNYFPVVLLTGARQVGKSTLAMQMLDNYVTMDDINMYLSAQTDPYMFIGNLRKPVIIDEIQKLPQLLVSIKRDVDRNRKNGSYLLTGSANIMSFKEITDTLAGRIAILELLPLSGKEIMHKNDNCIEVLFSRQFDKVEKNTITLENILMHVINGMFPEIQKIDTIQGRYLWFSSYIRTYIERDVRDIGELRNLDKFITMYNILTMYSGNVINKTNIASDAKIDIKTCENYLKLLQMVYHIYLLKPYSKNIGKRFIKNNKLYFADSGILCHLLGIHSIDDFLSSRFKGNILETFVFNEFIKSMQYTQKPATIYFYRTIDKEEIDFIIKTGNVTIAIEVKCAQTVTKDDFKAIMNFKQLQKNCIGYVIYLGDAILPFGNDCYAMPLRLFF